MIYEELIRAASNRLIDEQLHNVSIYLKTPKSKSTMEDKLRLKFQDLFSLLTHIIWFLKHRGIKREIGK